MTPTDRTPKRYPAIIDTKGQIKTLPFVDEDEYEEFCEARLHEEEGTGD